MTTTLSVPTDYSTIAAAFAATPSVYDDVYVIEVDGDAQWEYSENLSLTGKTVDENHYLILRGKEGYSRPNITSVACQLAYTRMNWLFIANSLDCNASDMIVERIRKQNTGLYGPCYLRANNILFRNNEIEGFSYYSSANSMLSMNGNNIKVIGNQLIVINNSSGIGIWPQSGCANLTIKDNVIGSHVAVYSLIRFPDDAAANGLNMNNNVYMAHPSSSYMIEYNGTQYTESDFAAFYAATGMEASQNSIVRPYSSICMPAVFVEDKGVADADLTDDINGNPRGSSNIDVGPVKIYDENVGGSGIFGVFGA